METLTKHISCKCQCRFDGKKSNSDHWWNNWCENDFVQCPATCRCEDGKNLASMMDDSAIACNEIIKS